MSTLYLVSYIKLFVLADRMTSDGQHVKITISISWGHTKVKIIKKKAEVILITITKVTLYFVSKRWHDFSTFKSLDSLKPSLGLFLIWKIKTWVYITWSCLSIVTLRLMTLYCIFLDFFLLKLEYTNILISTHKVVPLILYI